MSGARLLAILGAASIALSLGAAPPSPAEFLGYELGERLTPHHRIVGYFDRLAETSPLVDVERYGETTEHRELIEIIITSERNRQALATIRKELGELQRAGETSRERAKEIARSEPLVVLFGFGVHGDESSSPEVAMKLAYWLATASSAKPLLDDLVILIDPVQNPDGREQYVQFYTQAAGRKPDPTIDAFEHTAPWRTGRANHYFIDLNRDWIWCTQAESQARIRRFLDWSPQVVVDFHEMGSRDTDYFFPPSADPVNPNVAEGTASWLDTFGRANAEAFSEHGWLFYVGETYDLFYPGYGDAWPTLRGAIGMTFEVAGGRTAGRIVDRPNGTTLSLADRIERHFVAGRTTLETAAANREALILHAYDAARANVANETIYLIDGSAPASPFAVEILRRQGIEIKRLAATGSHEVRSVIDGREERRTFPEGTIVVSTAQAAGRLARTLLERSSKLEEEFVRQQRERVDADESDQFYDITAWSLPVALDLGVWELEGNGKLDTREWVDAPVHTAAASKLGWAVSATQAGIYRLAGLMLESGVRFSVATAPITIGDTTLPRGSYVVHRAYNDESLTSVFPRLAESAGVTAVPITSFWTRGIALGSSQIRFVREPDIALVAGSGVDRHSFGAIWFQLDVRDEIPHTVVPLERLATIDLNRYNVLVFPDGNYAGVPLQTRERLKLWTENGGTIVAVKGALDLTRSEEARLSSLEEWKPEGENEDEQAEPRRVPGVPGAAFRTEMNERSLLTVGLEASPPVLIDGNNSYKPLARKASNVVQIAAHDPLTAGFAWPESIERLEGAAYLVVESVGKGHVISFTDEPNFRLFWRGTYPLLMNAILYGPTIED